MTGRVHSTETFGALDGPGLRVVVFLQGCPLRCAYCHNPDTWNPSGGSDVSAEDLLARVCRYRPYFGHRGGLTLSGGEPLMQAEFAAEVFAGAKAAGIHTALDTSGAIWNASVEKLLSFTDLVILDIKHADPGRHMELTGCDAEKPLAFLRRVVDRGTDLWIRQVVLPGWSDSIDAMDALARLLREARTLKRVELLPYHRMAREKWRELGREYKLEDVQPPTDETMAHLRKHLQNALAFMSPRPEVG